MPHPPANLTITTVRNKGAGHSHKGDNKEVMEARLEEDLRLDELAREAGLSTLHFIRSSRESTGKTPYQFLLGQRVETIHDCAEGKPAMKNLRVSCAIPVLTCRV
jgi:transcriptional regulator GlxA family with amidase domain